MPPKKRKLNKTSDGSTNGSTNGTPSQSPLLKTSTLPPVDINLPLEDLVPSLLLPSDFKSQTFNTSCHHVKGCSLHLISSLKSILNDYDLESLYHESPSPSIQIFLPTKSPTADTIRVEPETASKLSSTHSTYCRGPPALSALFQSTFLSDLNLFNSNPNWGYSELEAFHGHTPHVTNWHYDFQHNFTIQLSGSKKWDFKKGERNVRLGCTPHFNDVSVVEGQILNGKLSNPDFEFKPPQSCDVSCVLSSGDFLYFPPGVFHRVTTVSTGLSVNISIIGKSYSDIYCDGLKGLLNKDVRWRGIVSSKSEFLKLCKEENDIKGEWIWCEGGNERVEESDSEEEEDVVIRKSKTFNVDDDFEGEVEVGGNLKVNPLSDLLTEKEITGYFRMISGHEVEEEEEGDNVKYILNVNYAGNDDMEATNRNVLECRRGGKGEEFLEGIRKGRVGEYEEGRKWLKWLGGLVDA
ncbi:hypothetical protein TrST_g2256 [Triparma strigata]|uniref:JmjC domain-containing protein n=1 Tax=Triparma strigata TaxID=1606541 RepID=A0A9W7ALF1_9STRA|nr:hypothetical protein TrST_g2256 [Triparma strigata]